MLKPITLYMYFLLVYYMQRPHHIFIDLYHNVFLITLSYKKTNYEFGDNLIKEYNSVILSHLRDDHSVKPIMILFMMLIYKQPENGKCSGSPGPQVDEALVVAIIL